MDFCRILIDHVKEFLKWINMWRKRMMFHLLFPVRCIIWMSSMGTTAIGQFVTPCAAIGCFTWTIVFLTKFFDSLTGSGHFGLGNGKYNSEKVWKLETLRK